MQPGFCRRPAAQAAGNPDARRAGEVGRPAGGGQARAETAHGGDQVRRRRRPRPAGRPAQHAGGERARYPPDDGLQLHAPDRVRRPSSSCSPTSSRATRTRTTREFTFKLRDGHKWSDGQPFTTEDFRFFWEDIANNKELSPSGPSVELMVDGQPPKVEIIDAAHHQVHLGQAQPLLHREPGARRPALPVPAGALPQEVPRQVHLARGHRQGGQGRPEHRQLGADLPASRRHVRQRQPRPADAQPVGQHHGLAGAALRLRAQSLLSPHRRQGAAAALRRPRDLHPGGDQPGAGQGRASARPTCSRAISTCATTPSCRRAPRARASRCGCGNRARARSSRSFPTSTPTTRSGAS